MAETFLVTGSEGCIGSWVGKRLVEAGERCVALDLDPAARRLRKIVDEERLEDVTFVAGDIVEEDVVARIAAEHEATRIIHLAALQIPFVASDPVRGALVNVVGTLRVFETARELSEQVQNVVYASSAAVFGPNGTSVQPSTLYGVFKIANEESARLYWQDHRLASVGLRPWAVFGPGRDQGLTAAPTHAMKAAVLGVPYHIPFGGRLDLQYADDVAATFVAAALAEPRGAVVGNLRGSVVSVEEFISVLEDVWPQAEGLITHGSDPLPIDPELDDTALRELLGDRPRTDLRAAVQQSMEHFSRLRSTGDLGAAEVP